MYEPHHKVRLAIKPGITGMWQVSGRSDITDFEEVVRLDNRNRDGLSKHFGHDEDDAIELSNRLALSLAEVACNFKNRLGGTVKFGFSSPGYNILSKKSAADLSGKKSGEPYNTHISCMDATYTEVVNFASKLNYDRQRFNGNVVDFFCSRKIGLNPQDYSEIVKKYSLSLDDILIRDHLSENNNFILFYNAIQNDIKNNAEKAYGGFKRYMESLNCTHDLQVVDIGWRCTMQYCLKNLLKNNYNIQGYYLGVREDAFVDKHDFLGLFLNGEDNKEKKVFLASMTALIEIFFSALHGSVEGYDIDGTPICGEHECANDLSCLQFISDLQEGAMQFVRDFNSSVMKNLLEVSIDEALEGIKKLGTKPQEEELKQSLGFLQDNVGNNISYKNSNYCELTGLYWIWKNVDDPFKGLVHYRRYFGKSNLSCNINDIYTYDEMVFFLNDVDIVLPYVEHFKQNAKEEILIECCTEDIFYNLEKIINEKYPEYSNDFKDIFSNNKCTLFNMLFCKAEVFDSYCEWLLQI